MHNRTPIGPGLINAHCIAQSIQLRSIRVLDKKAANAHWQVDDTLKTDLSALSSFKLLSIIQTFRLQDPDADSLFIQLVQAELVSRGDSQVWQAPH